MSVVIPLVLNDGQIERLQATDSIDKASVGLSNVDNTSDASKPVSTLQAAAIALKQTTFVDIKSVSFDGLGGFVTINSQQMFIIPSACTIIGWYIMTTGTSPTCTIDVYRIAGGTALPTVANTILTGSKLQLTTGNVLNSTTLTNFTSTVVTAGDIFVINVDAISAATKINFALKITY